MKKVIAVTKVQNSENDVDSVMIVTVSILLLLNFRMLMCSQLIVVCVERGDIRLEALAGTDGLGQLLKLAALFER